MKFIKIISSIVAIVLLSTFAIDASDTLQGNSGTMLASLIGVEQTVCEEGMVHMPGALTFACVDMYEASASESCVVTVPANQFDTEANITKNNCTSVSIPEAAPWRYVTREQASLLCTRAGKRLPTAAEWYQFTLGTPVSACVVSGSAATLGGAPAACVSAAGIYNGIGSVWEWVSDDVIDGKYQGRDLPDTGYVTQVDSDGIATVTASEETVESNGYAWFPESGAYGMIRGGYFGSREDAGLYTVHAATDPNFRGEAIGFRCIR